ncbi:hypothetical protein CFOL_v3_03544 [Cephalotus follicularis]|uniref:Uncharacterized protein n=1 Tax=Cephalotus follicularis TaxID=3775 RepID=A0A1Q3AWT0_CEPFO|nr:hypothetical protein CFOL_v3_03544 [Cephalotus follicularis]
MPSLIFHGPQSSLFVELQQSLFPEQPSLPCHGIQHMPYHELQVLLCQQTSYPSLFLFLSPSLLLSFLGDPSPSEFSVAVLIFSTFLRPMPIPTSLAFIKLSSWRRDSVTCSTLDLSFECSKLLWTTPEASQFPSTSTSTISTASVSFSISSGSVCVFPFFS